MMGIKHDKTFEEETVFYVPEYNRIFTVKNCLFGTISVSDELYPYGYLRPDKGWLYLLKENLRSGDIIKLGVL